MLDPKVRKLGIERKFTEVGTHPFDSIEWVTTDVSVQNFETEEMIFEQKEVEYPEFWSEQAASIVSQKYFYGVLAPEFREYPDERETSVKQLVTRVAKTYRHWAVNQHLFSSKRDYDIFEEELTYVLVNQLASFNSPVWFNLGLWEQHGWGRPKVTGKKLTEVNAMYLYVPGKGVQQSEFFYQYPQTAACFILSVEDDMGSILQHYVEEGKIFYGGSGAGVNISSLRSSFEPVSGKGRSSGPISFDRGWDQSAGAIKSGGKTRRAARMVEMNVWHPDVFEFVDCKRLQEEIGKLLIGQHGYDESMDGLVLGETLNFQNSNHTVVLDEAFIKAVKEDKEYSTRWVTDDKHIQTTFRARDLYKKMMESIWSQGEPGFQFTHTINKWNTVPNSGRINGSNPCGEFLFLDDTACNLMSINLLKFWNEEAGEFDIEAYEHVCRLLIICGELNNSNSGLPTRKLAENVGKFRTIGLGFGNLHTLLKVMGIPYDSDKARAVCGLMASLMTSTAYLTSIELSHALGPFEEYEKNRKPFLKIMDQHRDESEILEEEINEAFDEDDVLHPLMETLGDRSHTLWGAVKKYGSKFGFRNAQVSLIAPTGTIGFMMDLDAFGIEPEFGTVVYKKLAGGGSLRMVSKTTAMALRRLHYSLQDIEAIVEYIDENDTIEGAPGIHRADLPIFDCALRCGKTGTRVIDTRAHISMVAAAQRFLSGAVSKTINAPETSTVEDLWDLALFAEDKGVKSLTIYRNGSRGTAPLSTFVEGEEEEAEPTEPTEPPIRVSMPDRALGIRQKFRVGDQSGYLHVGFYPSGRIGEVFLTMNKEGDTVSGFAGVFAKLLSNMLQCGYPLEEVMFSLGHTKFEPSGFTGVDEVKYADSPVDFVVRFTHTVQERVKEIGIKEFLLKFVNGEIENPQEVVIEETEANLESLGATRKGYRKYKKCPKCSNPELRDPDGCPNCPICGWGAGCGGG